MHKIIIYTSSKKNKIEDKLNFPDFPDFVYHYHILRDTHLDVMDFVLDEDSLELEEFSYFLSILFDRPFENKDNCKTIEELIEWAKSFQFLSFLDEEISWFFW